MVPATPRAWDAWTHEASNVSVDVGVAVVVVDADEVEGGTEMDLSELAGSAEPGASMPRAPITMNGGKLRAARKRLGMKQAELAAALGYSRSQICAWEKGTYAVPFVAYAQILQVFEARARQLEEYRRQMDAVRRWPSVGQQ